VGGDGFVEIGIVGRVVGYGMFRETPLSIGESGWKLQDQIYAGTIDNIPLSSNNEYVTLSPTYKATYTLFFFPPAFLKAAPRFALLPITFPFFNRPNAGFSPPLAR
jgi:hypothetical protein